MMAILVLIAVVAGIGISYLMGLMASRVVGTKEGSALRYITIGVLGGLLSGLVIDILDIHDFWLSIPLYGMALLVVAFLLQPNVPQDTKTVKKASKKNMPNLDYKSLIRIPVWALYSLIIATVVMSVVMLVNIWFPETIDEELIWKIILSYAVFLISALVIANLTDRVKTMKQFEEEK